MEGRKRRRQSRWKKIEEDRRKGLISTLEEEDGKGLADICRLPTGNQFQVAADNKQLNIYGLVQLVFPKHSDRIVSGELSAASWLTGASISAELLNTSCLSF